MEKSNASQAQNTKFSIGDRVVKKSSLNICFELMVGEVIALRPRNIFVVEWDSDPTYNQIYVERLEADELISELESKTYLAIQKAEQSKLDAEFEAVKENIFAKIKLAATSINEAVILCKAANKDFHDLGKEVQDLVKSFKNAGWTSSSLQC